MPVDFAAKRTVGDTPGFDIFGDIHGQCALLQKRLYALGYRERKGVWRHAVRRAFFLGDLIDRGPHSFETALLVRRMTEADAARCIMGNHELNAICWAKEDGEGGFLRPHTYKNQRQHQAFLEAAQGRYAAEYPSLIGWFASLPLWHEEEGAQFVHACWNPVHMARLAPYLNARNAPAGDAFFFAACQKGTEEYTALETISKGIEIPLPNGIQFLDKDGYPRTQIRVRWWDNTPNATYRQLALLDDTTRAGLPDTPIPPAVFTPVTLKHPTFVGHYWLNPQAPKEPLGPLLACLDYSAGLGGPLVAYRWNSGERTLCTSCFV